MNLTTAYLRELLVLTKRREAIVAKLDTVNGKLGATIGGKATPAKINKLVALANAPNTSKSRAKKAKRGTMKDSVLKALESMGEAGGNLAALARKTGLNANSLAVWLYTSGKKLAEVEKVSRGVFRHSANAAKSKPAKTSKKAAKKKATKKKAQTKRGK